MQTKPLAYIAALAAMLTSTATQAVTISLPLTLTPANNSANRFNFFATVPAPIVGSVSDSDQSDLSGTVNAQLSLSVTPTGADIDGVRFTGGMIDASDIDLDFRVLFVTVATVDGRNLGGEIQTTVSGFSTVTGGAFATEDHQVRIDQGTLEVTGAATGTTNLASTPFELTQPGTGTITLQRLDTDGGPEADFGVTLNLPIDATEMLTNPDATVEVDGTAVATGQFSLTLPLPPLDGDFNNDGMVDAADYTIWRDAFEIGEAPASDYLVWRENYGNSISQQTALTPAATPEPTAAGLLTLALAALGGRRRP